MLLDFCIDATRPELRELLVTLEFDLPDRAGAEPVQLFLPTWTPGSYLIREYARHLGRVAAMDAADRTALPCHKVAKNRFELHPAPTTRRVRVSYRVYAHELTVRTADVTADHAFWNHACVLLWPVEAAGWTARIRVEHRADWRLACSLPREAAATPVAGDHTAATTLLATDLDAAIDAPCLVGTFQQLEWRVDGVAHGVALDGLATVSLPPTLLDDLTRIVVQARRVFGGALPYRSYLFLCLFSDTGHGGLEHRDSSTLLASRTACAGGKGYREFLGLAAHELFHAWNVKRMRPAQFWRYDYEHENHTELLWLIEGWTAYYDDLLCRRAGLLGREEYLQLLGKNIDTLRATPGRHALSLSESSFDAWIRLYRPDANTRNSSQNYYLNGSLAALCLDAFLRHHSDGAASLDDVVRRLYADTHEQGRGYTRHDVDVALAAYGGPAAVEFLATLVDGPLDPDFAAVLAPLGIRVTSEPGDRPHLGVTFTPGGTTIASVETGTPAHVAGLAPGDELLAVQELRVDAARWGEIWKAVARAGEPVAVLLSRRGVIRTCSVTPEPSRGTTKLQIDPDAPPRRLRVLEGWLDPDGNDAPIQARRPGDVST